jgi:acetyl esterase/lipase
MIRPELRVAGIFYKMMAAGFTENSFHGISPFIKMTRGRHSRSLNYEQIFIPRPDGSEFRLCVYSPLIRRTAVPGLLWIHGGGYAIGSPEQDEAFARLFVEANGCVVVAPDYTLSTVKPYPAALDDCYAALLWLKENGGHYGMRPDQIFVGGDSAGGGLAAAVTLKARDLGEVDIAFQMPLYPMIDDRMDTESARDNNAPVWKSRANRISWKMYLGDLFESGSVPIYAAPARNTDFSRLPPALSYVGSVEPFRDEVISYLDKLKQNGTESRYKVFDGCFHGFDIVCAGSKIAKEAREFLLDGFLYASKHYFTRS